MSLEWRKKKQKQRHEKNKAVVSLNALFQGMPMTHRKQRVAIFGGGVGGLTVAYVLSQYPDRYSIDLYERHSEVGGMARSSRDSSGCATEYCWRVFFGFYKHLFRVLHHIPLVEAGDGNGNGHGVNTAKTVMTANPPSVMNNFVPYRNITVSDSPTTWAEMMRMAYWLWYGFSSCDERMRELDNWKWSDVMKKTGNSHILRQVGPWLGMDRVRASYKSVIEVGFEWNVLGGEENYVTSQPTSEAMFDPWVAYLQRWGVRLHRNHELLQLDNSLEENNRRNRNKKRAQIRDLRTGRTWTDDQIDIVVLALPVEVLQRVAHRKWFLSPKTQANLQTLATTCLHMQVAFQVYFNIPVWLGHNTQWPVTKELPQFSRTWKNNSFIVTDAPWDLIVLQYDQTYDFGKTVLCSHLEKVRGGWSIAVCTAYRPGIRIRKPFYQCTEDEIHLEIWAQLRNSRSLDALVQQFNSGRSLEQLEHKHVIHWSPMWPGFQYDPSTHHIRMREPKFTNNAGSLALRPSFRTLDESVFVATAYVQETIGIFSMEAACLGGKKVATAITCDDWVQSEVARPRAFAVFRALDSCSWRMGGPNLGLLWLACLFGVVLYGVGRLASRLLLVL